MKPSKRAPTVSTIPRMCRESPNPYSVASPGLYGLCSAVRPSLVAPAMSGMGERNARETYSAANRQELALALRTQADRLVAGEMVTGLERINLLYEAADFVERCKVELRLLDADTAVVVSRALDLLGLALADERHVWTAEERESYETAIRGARKT